MADPQSVAPVEVVVVGGGAAGVLVASRILDATRARPARVRIVEPGDLAAGVAYGTDDPDHLLNVRAAGMTADPSHPDELVEWVKARGLGDRDTFIPRREYRRYLREHLAAAAAAANDGVLEHVRDTATSIELVGDGAEVVTGIGRRLACDAVVLAIGNPSPGVPPPLDELAGHPAWIPDPWAPAALARVAPEGTIVLVGTGLTMVDVAITLGRESGRTMVALSRHGLLPRHHIPNQPHRTIEVIDLQRDSGDVLALVERVRQRIRDRPDEDWREVIDAIRPYANALWQRFDDDQQRIFLEQVSRHWDVHRHRMSPKTHARFDVLVHGGRLTVHEGSVQRVVRGDRNVTVEATLDGEAVQIDAASVVNCTGPGRPWLPPANPIVADLVERGLAVPDPRGLGLVTTPEGCLVGRDGSAVPQVLVIGPPRKGTLFETTAIPEVRSQALHIADHVVIGDPFA